MLQPKMEYANAYLRTKYTSRAIANICGCTVQMIVKDYRQATFSTARLSDLALFVRFSIFVYAMCNNDYSCASISMVCSELSINLFRCEPMLSREYAWSGWSSCYCGYAVSSLFAAELCSRKGGILFCLFFL